MDERRWLMGKIQKVPTATATNNHPSPLCPLCMTGQSHSSRCYLILLTQGYDISFVLWNHIIPTWTRKRKGGGVTAVVMFDSFTLLLIFNTFSLPIFLNFLLAGSMTNKHAASSGPGMKIKEHALNGLCLNGEDAHCWVERKKENAKPQSIPPTTSWVWVLLDNTQHFFPHWCSTSSFKKKLRLQTVLEVWKESRIKVAVLSAEFSLRWCYKVLDRPTHGGDATQRFTVCSCNDLSPPERAPLPKQSVALKQQ